MSDRDRPGAALPPELSPRRGRRPSMRRGRVLRRIAATLSILVVLASLGLYGLYLHYNGRIRRVAITGNTLGAPDKGGAENFLLVGSDSRQGATAAELREAHTTPDGGGTNTDVMMVAHVGPGGTGVDFISIPRDSWVDIPGHGDNKLNAAYALGGPGLLIRMVEKLTGIHIDHFLMVNFFGFIDIADAVGGVRVCVPTAEHDSYSGINLTAGWHTLNGPEALEFVRQRHGLALGDLDRIRRQQEFIDAVMHKVESPSILLNPVRMYDLLNAVTGSITADKGLSLSDLRRLALAVHSVGGSHVKFLTYPVVTETYYPLGPGGPDAVEINEQLGKALFRNVLDNLPPTTGAPTGKLTVSPSAINVRVENSTGRTGLAHAAAATLSALGFAVAGTGNVSGVSATTVRYGPGELAAARTVQATVPGARLQADPSLGGTVVLELAGGYDGIHYVTVTTRHAANQTAQFSGAKVPCST